MVSDVDFLPSARSPDGYRCKAGLVRVRGAVVKALLAGVLATCVAGHAGAGPAPKTVTTLPPADSVQAAALSQQDYRIGPLDTLEVSVFHVDGLNRTVQVDSAGQINLPLIGGVAAAGKTATQLADDIALALGRKYLQSPQVTVFVSKSQSQKFTIEGAVREPGVYDMAGRMTLLQAIATAKGVEQNAQLKHVVIFRMVDAKRMAAVVNLADVRKGKVDDPQIYPTDVIVVAGSNSDRVLKEIIGVSPLLVLLGL